MDEEGYLNWMNGQVNQENHLFKEWERKYGVKDIPLESKPIKGGTNSVADNVPGKGYHNEVYANKPAKVTDAVDKWEEFLGPGEYTDIHPRTGLKDPNRIVSADGKRSIRFGPHEMDSKPNKFHYHEEIWTYDPIKNVMNVDNTVIRVPYK